MRLSMLAIVMLVLLGSMAHADDGLNWRSHAMAMPEAERTGKPVIIHFTADWCSWCTKMKEQTYTDPDVAKIMDTQFITAMVDTDQFQLLSMFYGVQSLPTIWIVGSDGQGITKISGYRDAPAFRKYLDWVTSGAHLTKGFEQFASEGS